MDRMTKWNGNKYILPQGKGEFRRIADRLAAYEDTWIHLKMVLMFSINNGLCIL